MIQNSQELKATLDRIEYFQKQIEKLRRVETNPRNYELSAGGFLAEIERMNLEVHHFLAHKIYILYMNQSLQYAASFPLSSE